MNCDSIARAYRWIEYSAYGPALEFARRRWLAELAGAKRVLVLGDGDGRFLSRFAAKYRSVDVHYIDSSQRMLELARRRIDKQGLSSRDRLYFTHGDALETDVPEHDYDLVVSHFFLDCFDEQELRRLAERVGPHLTPQARWVVSDFREPKSGWLAPVFRFYLRLMFLFFRYTSGLETRRLADYSVFLRNLGFVVTKRAGYLGDFVFSEIWSRPAFPLRNASNEPCGQHDN